MTWWLPVLQNMTHVSHASHDLLDSFSVPRFALGPMSPSTEVDRGSRPKPGLLLRNLV